MEKQQLPKFLQDLIQKYGFENKQDFCIQNSEAFSIEERQILIQNMYSFKITVKTQKFTYIINTRFIYMPQKNIEKNPVFFLHGHDNSCTWLSWLRVALKAVQDNRNVLLIDLPGFGQSYLKNEENSFTIKYKYDSCHMLVQLIDMFKLKDVHAVGWCGGGANFYRTIAQYPGKFAKTHIFYNVVISQIPDNFEKNIIDHKMKVWASWIFDNGEHSKYCMGYKWLKQKNEEKNSNIRLTVLNGNELGGVVLWSQNMGKNTSGVVMLEPSQNYIDFFISFLNGGNTKLKYQFSKGNNAVISDNFEQDLQLQKILQQSQQEYLEQYNENKNLEQKEIEIALKLSLNDY